MKTLIVALTMILAASAATAATKELGLSDIAKHMRDKNFKVREGAVKVQQARVNIEKARADLLPRLTIWTIAQYAVNPTEFLNPLNILDKITDIAPFLVPANWFRVEENRILLKAEREGYRALWGNELHAAKSLFYRIQFDQKLLAHVLTSTTELEQAWRIVEEQERLGGVRAGTARDIEIRVIGLKEDAENLRLLISQELMELSYVVGLKADVDVVLRTVSDPDVANLPNLDVGSHESRVLSMSPERKQFDHVLAALEYVKDEIDWSFFGVSTTSRGVAGGVFDNIPITEGFFGSDASMKIAKAQGRMFKLQKTGVEETLRRQLRNLVNQYNSDIRNYGLYSRRSQLAKESNDALLGRAQLGESVNSLEFSENVRNRIQAETNKFAAVARVLVNRDRLDRMTFRGDYVNK